MCCYGDSLARLLFPADIEASMSASFVNVTKRTGFSTHEFLAATSREAAETVVS